MPIQNKLLRGVLLAGSTAYMGKLVYSQTTCQQPHPFDTKVNKSAISLSNETGNEMMTPVTTDFVLSSCVLSNLFILTKIIHRDSRSIQRAFMILMTI
jgi:hypothetical protein